MVWLKWSCSHTKVGFHFCAHFYSNKSRILPICISPTCPRTWQRMNWNRCLHPMVPSFQPEFWETQICNHVELVSPGIKQLKQYYASFPECELFSCFSFLWILESRNPLILFVPNQTFYWLLQSFYPTGWRIKRNARPSSQCLMANFCQVARRLYSSNSPMGATRRRINLKGRIPDGGKERCG